MGTGIQIRDVQPEDYPAVADVIRAAEPPDSHNLDADAIARMDHVLAGRSRAQRRVAEIDNQIVGTCRYLIPPHMYHPQKYQFYISVLPETQRQGIGTALYDDTLARLQSENPISLRSFYREDMANSRDFLATRGFTEEFRLWESWLDLTRFDPAPFAAATHRMRESGIRIRTLADVRNDPGWERRLHALIIHIQGDMPQPEPYVPWPFDEWLKVELNRPTMIPESYFIAVDGDEYIGVNILFRQPGNPKRLNTDDTGVLRTYRRRGLATALKVHGLEYAKAHGVERVYTANASTNQPMLALNTKLGFQRNPAHVGVIRHM